MKCSQVEWPLFRVAHCACVHVVKCKKGSKHIFQRAARSGSFRFGHLSLEPPINSGIPLSTASAKFRCKNTTTPSRVHLVTLECYSILPGQGWSLLEDMQHMTVCAWLINAFIFLNTSRISILSKYIPLKVTIYDWWPAKLVCLCVRPAFFHCNWREGCIRGVTDPAGDPKQCGLGQQWVNKLSLQNYWFFFLVSMNIVQFDLYFQCKRHSAQKVNYWEKLCSAVNLKSCILFLQCLQLCRRWIRPLISRIKRLS